MIHTALDFNFSFMHHKTHDDSKLAFMTQPSLQRVKNRHNPALTTSILLMTTTVIALILANLPSTNVNYFALVNYTSGISLFHHDLGLRFVVNEILMCVFFFHIGLELKYSLCNGDLRQPQVATMPLYGAVGGMLVPMLCYLYFNFSTGGALRGWAIPTATDIAFALGVLALIENRIPSGLKAFLLALAIFDDLGAIMIIALFYSHQLNLFGLCASIMVCLYLYRLNRRQHLGLRAYVIAAILLWFTLFVTGIHTTIGAVITAIAIPLSTTASGQPSYGNNNNLYRLAHKLSPLVNTCILPLFAFFNAGTNVAAGYILLHPVGQGIITGLLVGKPLGILLFCAIGEHLGHCKRPQAVTWHHIIGMSFLCGIGFTMSLFIGKLAFYKAYHHHLLAMVKKSVLVASFFSGFIGLAYLACQPKAIAKPGR